MSILSRLKLSRKRSFFTLWLSVIFMITYFLIDPDNKFISSFPLGANSTLLLLSMLKAATWISFLHWSRKAIFDYNEADLAKLIGQASKTSQGAGLVVIGIGIFVLAFALVIYASIQI